MPLAERVVEVIAELGPPAGLGYRYGSGCRVAGRTVLTAAHVVAGAHAVLVRGPDKVEHSAVLDPAFVGDPDGPDLAPDVALLTVTDGPDVPAMPLAVVNRGGAGGDTLERCQAIGYPEFAERGSAGSVRDTVHTQGHIPVLSQLVSGLLTLQVSSSPEPLPPADQPLPSSPWAGMSGAPVLAAGHLIGVVTEHAPRAGPSAITVTPLTALDHDPDHLGWGPGVPNPGEWWARMGAPGRNASTLLRLPRRRERPAAPYRATIRVIHELAGHLVGRADELAAIADFATGPPGYRWLIGDAWAGKTADLGSAGAADHHIGGVRCGEDGSRCRQRWRG